MHEAENKMIAPEEKGGRTLLSSFQIWVDIAVSGGNRTIDD
jgi:hypothetical protein